MSYNTKTVDLRFSLLFFFFTLIQAKLKRLRSNRLAQRHADCVFGSAVLSLNTLLDSKLVTYVFFNVASSLL